MANRDDERHPSRQLAALLRSEIEHLDAGTKLPAYRELAERHHMARGTVQSAMRLLELEGLVEIRGTAGAYIRDRTSAGAGREQALRAELIAVRQQLKDAKRVLADTEEAVSSLLKHLPAELPVE